MGRHVTGRHLYKSWQDRRPEWTRRVLWYQGTIDVRLEFEDEDGHCHRIFPYADQAQFIYDAFRDGTIGTLSIMRQRSKSDAQENA